MEKVSTPISAISRCVIIMGILSTVQSDEVSRCYSVNGEDRCFYTDGSVLSWNEAREFCESKNATLPIITDEDIDNVFQQFIVTDSYNVIHNSHVWLDAHARDVNNSVPWHWVNGRPSALTDTSFLQDADDNWCASVATGSGQQYSVDLHENRWIDKQFYVCQYDNKSECSPRWIVRPNLHGTGAHAMPSARTPRECLEVCITDRRCVAVDWNVYYGCYMHDQHRSREYYHAATQFEIVRQCYSASGPTCEDSFQINSTCYKVHRNESVDWFTAVNRCLANNASLAVFDDDVRDNIPSSLLTERAWIGLLKSWWTWPSLDDSDLMYNKFNVSSSTPPDNPPERPNTNYNCVVATTGHWEVANCMEQHRVVCQSDHDATSTPTTGATLAMGKSDTTVALIVGISVGAVVLIFLAVVVLVVVWKCRRRRSDSTVPHPANMYEAFDVDSQSPVFYTETQPAGKYDETYANFPSADLYNEIPAKEYDGDFRFRYGTSTEVYANENLPSGYCDNSDETYANYHSFA